MTPTYKDYICQQKLPEPQEKIHYDIRRKRPTLRKQL